MNYSSLFIDKQTLLYLQYFQMCTIWEQRSKKKFNFESFSNLMCKRKTCHKPLLCVLCFSHLIRVHKKWSSTWIINHLLYVLVWSIAEYFYELCRILTSPYGEDRFHIHLPYPQFTCTTFLYDFHIFTVNCYYFYCYYHCSYDYLLPFHFWSNVNFLLSSDHSWVISVSLVEQDTYYYVEYGRFSVLHVNTAL